MLGKLSILPEIDLVLTTQYQYLPYEDRLWIIGGTIEPFSDGSIKKVDGPKTESRSIEELERFWDLLNPAQSA